MYAQPLESGYSAPAFRGAPLVDIEANVAKNRMEITVVSRPARGELADLGARVRAAANQLQQPFDILTDLTGLTSFDAELLTASWGAAEALRTYRVRRAVRVINSSSLLFKVLERVAHFAGTDGVTTHTRAEAEAVLDQPSSDSTP